MVRVPSTPPKNPAAARAMSIHSKVGAHAQAIVDNENSTNNGIIKRRRSKRSMIKPANTPLIAAAKVTFPPFG